MTGKCLSLCHYLEIRYAFAQCGKSGQQYPRIRTTRNLRLR